jgi:hypothetical protein
MSLQSVFLIKIKISLNVMSKKDIVIYSSTTGGIKVQKNTEIMSTLISCLLKSSPTVIFLDLQEEHKQMVWDKSGKKGVYPLLFIDNRYMGDIEQINILNDTGELSTILGV